MPQLTPDPLGWLIAPLRRFFIASFASFCCSCLHGGGYWEQKDAKKMKIAWPARLRKFQFSLTMLFVLVTLSAVGVDFFRRRADMLQTANWHWLHSIGVSQDAPWEMRVDADYHRRMRIKYKRAAWFPWIPVSEEPSSRDYFHKSADS